MHHSNLAESDAGPRPEPSRQSVLQKSRAFQVHEPTTAELLAAVAALRVKAGLPASEYDVGFGAGDVHGSASCNN